MILKWDGMATTSYYLQFWHLDPECLLIVLEQHWLDSWFALGYWLLEFIVYIHTPVLKTIWVSISLFTIYQIILWSYVFSEYLK